MDQSNGNGASESAITEGGKVVVANVLGFRKVEFTRHAILQMKIRGITEQEVLNTLRKPQETGLPTNILRERVRRFRSRKIAVDVVFERLADRIVVVTAILVQMRD